MVGKPIAQNPKIPEEMICLSQNEKRAAKEHRCDWCGDTIKVGEIYDYSSMVNGDFYVWKNHKDCAWIAHELNMFDDCDDGVSDQDFWEFITDYYNDNVPIEEDTLKTHHEKLKWVIDHRKNQIDKKPQ
jgi:hypothetical protein